MKIHITLLAVLCFSVSNAQNVGINTNEPKANLDINGNLMVRTVNAVPIGDAPVGTTYDPLVVNSATNEVLKSDGFFKNTTLAKAISEDGLSLLSGTLFAGWQKINFVQENVLINPGGHLDVNDDFYIIPSDGIYEINYEVRFGTGVELSALNFGGTPRIGILKHAGTGYTVLDERSFSGAGLPLIAKILISNSSINTVYNLTAGDKLSFEVNAGGINLNVLGNGFASVTVKKISN